MYDFSLKILKKTKKNKQTWSLNSLVPISYCIALWGNAIDYSWHLFLLFWSRSLTYSKLTSSKNHALMVATETRSPRVIKASKFNLQDENTSDFWRGPKCVVVAFCQNRYSTGSFRLNSARFLQDRDCLRATGGVSLAASRKPWWLPEDVSAAHILYQIRC